MIECVCVSVCVTYLKREGEICLILIQHETIPALSDQVLSHMGHHEREGGREREEEREGGRERARERERGGGRERAREGWREGESERGVEGGRERERGGGREGAREGWRA